MRRAHYRALLLASFCAALVCAAVGSAEPRQPTIDPARVRGVADAPVTIVEFADYQCPFCKRSQKVLDQLLYEFKGKVRLAHKDFPLPSHPGAFPAAEAARCAGAQGVFWEYNDLLYIAAPDFSRDDFVRYAGRLGIDREAFAACLDAKRYRKEIEADIAEGRAWGVRGTPTFVINGAPLVGAQPIEAFRDAVRDALQDAGEK